ncbi:uncharacterized protein LOC143584305 isoform X1 [Bidens hawaiensis]|uniref:uncharacterized protein LOC143584305 isoform X1 n=1 Tax=Bidens hawaiensis TaxID=980011 RepID=UPI00404A0B3E
MLEFEHSDSAPVIKTDHLGNVKEDLVPVCVKRKPESIRKRFYALQKKIRLDHLPAEPPVLDICGPLQDEPVDILTYEPAHNTGIVNLDVNQYEEESDGFEEILELLEAKGPESLPPIDEPKSENFDEYPIIQNMQNVNLGDAELENQMCCDGITTGVTNSTNYLINDLFDLTMEEDGLPLMDADGNLIDMTYLDDMSSRWLDSPNAKHDTVLADEFLDNNNYNKGQSESDNLETKTSDGLLMAPFKPLVTSAIICTLNTKDPDIPSNDDVFLLNLVPSTSQEMRMDAFKSPLPTQSTSKSRVSKQIIPKSNRYEQPQFSSPIIGSQFRSEVQVDHRIKQDFCNEDRSAIISRSNLFPASEKVTVKSDQDTHNISSVRTVVDNKTGGSDIFTNHAQFNPMAAVQQKTLHPDLVPSEVNNSCFVERNLPINEEAISSQSDDDGDYDHDMPSFSDVEAMIIDEDASLDEQHLYMNRIGSSELLQTFIYENAEARKAIMRLEQAANAFVKRDIKSHGAFAILQGRHVKYYVKKPEVLIGRETEEFHVDIDLGREGQNTRVSRRQAILHMDHEGSFHMKNLGKYSIFINNIELATNQSITLTSSCLVEIKGMAFLFETNKSLIKQYVNSTKNKIVKVDS